MRSLRTLGASCGAAAVWFGSQLAQPPSTADCDAPLSNPPKIVPFLPPQSAAVSISELRRWLERRGCDLSGITICKFSSGGDATSSYGVFASEESLRRSTRGIWGRLGSLVGLSRGDITLATFPIKTSITAASICNTPGHGELIAELLESGAIDERTAVVLHLVVERARGTQSPLRPWLALLPTSFSTPLFWNESDLAWLKGTALHRAVHFRKRQLEESWRRLEPVCAQMAVQEGASRKATLADFLWAHSIFWSRALAFPAPDNLSPGDSSKEGHAASTTPPSSSGNTSSITASNSNSLGTSSKPTSFSIQEGLVPGLDFCNHSPQSLCSWTVKGPGGTTLRSGTPPSELQLVCTRGSRLLPGSEITISYGEKSNEELLFTYGFALEHNPHDILMIACPLPPPTEWDRNLQGRVMLLQSRGLTPQVFLPAAHLAPGVRGGCGNRKGHLRFHGRTRKHELSGSVPAGSVACVDPVAELDLPEGVMETLEVFVMEPKDVAAELEDGGGGGGGAAAGRKGSARSIGEMEQSGLRLALLTTLVRLLELKIEELEGNEAGTGPLEVDEKLLEQGVGKVSKQQHAALVYRIGQKRLAREYLLYGNGLLQQELRHLRALSEKQT